MTDRCDVRARPYVDFDYPRSSQSPATGGEWPAGVEAFRVEEIPLYPFCGEGEHAALVVEKTDRATRDLAVAVARRLGVPNAAVGYAGMKDKDCVSVQAFTVTGAKTESARESFEAEGCLVLEATRHRNKLRLGHLVGNRFRILLTGVERGSVEAILSELAETGAPNYFGPQRFGARGDNALQGLAVLQRRLRTDRWKRDLFVSSLQSLVFNEVLARRIEDGLLGAVVAGDVLRKEDSGGVFVSEDVEVDQLRLRRFEVSPTGPIPGKKMIAPKAAASEREASVLQAFGLEDALFAGETGSRRPLRVRLEGCGVETCAQGVWLTFSCPAGTYATAVVREVTGQALRGVGG
jgi:tRNA pseudouridine13 synthase